jgi:hypothetical protein
MFKANLNPVSWFPSCWYDKKNELTPFFNGLTEAQKTQEYP